MKSSSKTDGTINREISAKLFNDPIANRQSQSGAFSNGLGGKKGIEHSRHDTLWDSVPSVRNVHYHLVAFNPAPYFEQSPTGTDGVDRVIYEIHENLLHF